MDSSTDDPSWWLDRFLTAHPDGSLEQFDAWADAQAGLTGSPQLCRATREELSEWLGAVKLLGLNHGLESGSLFRRRDQLDAEKSSTRTEPETLHEGKQIGTFTLRRYIARGGMGQVWEAEDSNLRRQVALKLVLPARIDERSMELFTREARAGGRLSHPNLVTTLGYGTDAGLTWIALELVPGSWTVKDALDYLRSEQKTPAEHYQRVAELVASIADGMQAAHDAGVIHRDLKPHNILITEDDQPKVTDFGLARVVDDSFMSQVGDFGGTWAYMSPEQVTAKRMGLDHRTDIFSLGVVLYELLTLRRPFEGDTGQQIAAQIIGVDPPPARDVRSQCPRELSVICAKAIEKLPDRRYASMADLAADLRRYLANEPILARPPGPVERAVKWMRRHPAISSAGAIGVVALSVVSLLLVDAEEQAKENAELARLANRRANDVLALSATKDLEDLVLEAEELWPAHPELLPRYESWLADAAVLLEGSTGDGDAGARPRPSLLDHETKLAELIRRSVPQHDEDALARAREHESYPELELARGELEELTAEADAQERLRLETQVASLELLVGERIFDDPQDAWWQRQLATLIRGIRELHDPETGLAGRTLAEPFGWGVGERACFARDIAERSTTGEEAAALWSQAAASIAASEHYGGLGVSPQMGLLPIGQDPASGLWEFAHLASGEVASRNPEGELELTEETGLVLVLVPGSHFRMGAQGVDPTLPGYFEGAAENEGPVHEVTLSPYFLSKFEMTQAQWQRATASNPSYYKEGAADSSGLSPVEQVSWNECMRVMKQLGLELPTEAQWENGCRAGTDTPWWLGPEREALRSRINIADRTAAEAGAPYTAIQDWPDNEDGGSVHLQVGHGSYPANSFGLHEVHGNVWEWCRDGFDSSAYGEESRLDPVVPHEGATFRVLRGGSFTDSAPFTRSSYRSNGSAVLRSGNLGLRPARRLDPGPTAPTAGG